MIKEMKKHAFALFLIAQVIIFTLLALSFGDFSHNVLFIFYSIIIVLCALSFYFLYVICQEMSFHAQLEAENLLLKQQEELQSNHLTVSKKNIELMNEMRDDIYNKLESYKDINITNEEDAREFAKKLMEEYTSLYQIDYCDNKIIDAILYNKLIVAHENNIKTSVQVLVPETLPIKPIDIISVYTNLIDNAIEACINLDEDKRYINIDSMIKSNYLLIKVTNSKDPQIKLDHNHLTTTKQDSDNHGLGTQIIKNVCHDNHGTFTMEDKGDYVESSALLQLEVQ